MSPGGTQRNSVGTVFLGNRIFIPGGDRWAGQCMIALTPHSLTVTGVSPGLPLISRSKHWSDFSSRPKGVFILRGMDVGINPNSLAKPKVIRLMGRSSLYSRLASRPVFPSTLDTKTLCLSR